MPLDFDVLYDAALGFEDAPEECERIVRRVYEAVLRPGDAAVDVGAHVGKHTLPMALVCGRKGSVVALEPIPWAHQRLVERLEASGLGDAARALHACCSDVPGEATFSVVASHPGWSSLVPRPDAADVQEIRVRQTTLDDECLSGPPVRFVKIDVEGAEELVLRGAQELLRRDRPVIHVEVVLSALQAFGTAVGSVRDALHSHGYQLFDLLGNDVTEARAWERSVTAPGLSDYVAVHPDSAAFAVVRDVLASSFAQERWDRVHAPPGLMLPPLGSNEHPAPGVRPMDGARPLPERLVRPVGPVPATEWPEPADARAELLLTDPVAWLNPRRGSVQSAVHATATALPVRISPSTLAEQRALRITLTLAGFEPSGTQTVLELHWPDARVVALVRYVRGSDLEVLWLDENGKALTSASSEIAAAGEELEVGLTLQGTTVSVSVRSGGAFATDSHQMAATGAFVGTIGERRFHVSRERLRVEEAVLSASSEAVTPPGAEPAPVGVISRALRRLAKSRG